VAVVVVVGGLALAEGVGVRRYLVHWSDTESLYSHMLKSAPEASVLRYGQGRLYQDQGQLDEAIEAYRAAVRFKRDLPMEREWASAAHNNLGGLLLARGDVKDAVRHYRAGWKTSDNRVSVANNLAWIMATNPDDTIRDGAHAVEMAEFACQATDYGDPTMLDTLAAAQAEAGRYEEAVKTAKKAIALTPKELARMIADIKQRLALYKSGKPYRDQPAANPSE
jgi:tetratricopeptide (TPR) repeat protein